jgi:hypothetical protein
MSKTIYIHIGTEKTGSTALQAVSGVNRKALSRHGILYPAVPGDRNHIRLTLFAADGPKTVNLRRLAGLASNASFTNFRAKFAEELRIEIEESRCTRIYLSNEHLSSRLVSKKEIIRLADVVRPLGEIVKIVVYLRPQAELFLSSYSTAIKAGRLKPLEPPAGIYDRRYNYERTLSLWADVFGEENVLVRIYDRKTLVAGDVVKDFFSTIGFEPGSDIKIPAVVNARLDSVTLRFLQEFNRHVPSFVKGSVNPERGDIASALTKKSIISASGVSASILRKIAELYKESNGQIARRFLNRSDGKLFDDVNYLDSPETEQLTAERAVEICAHLWRWKQRQYLIAKREMAMLKSNNTSTKKIE